MAFFFFFFLLLLVAYLLWDILVRTFVILLNNNIKYLKKIVRKLKTTFSSSTAFIATQCAMYSISNIFKRVFQSKTPSILHILKSYKSVFN